MQIGLEAGHPTEALLGRVKVVAEHHREAVGVIMDPISGSKYLKALASLACALRSRHINLCARRLICIDEPAWLYHSLDQCRST